MRRQKGQILVFVVLFIPILIVILSFVLATGKMVYYRIKLQNATDAAAYTAALWQARGLNVISDLNWALIAAVGGDIALILENPTLLLIGDKLKCFKAIQRMQDGYIKSFPGLAGMAIRANFKSNIDNAKWFPLCDSMFSLRIRRYYVLKIKEKGVPLYMEKSQPEFWIEQNKKGPFIRIIGVRFKDKIVFGGGFLGLEIPQMNAVAQAIPTREGDAYLGTEYLGGLWDPNFYAKLSPVSARVPLVKGLVFH
jgi:hypothetical protein